MDLSLSIVFPAHNAESTLTHDVHRLLELLPDLTPRFEILIVDDGSTDQTEEIAHELALQYPQLRVARHQRRQGQATAVETAMTQTTADVVFVQEEGSEIRAAEIRRLWDMRHDPHLVMARAELPRKTVSPHLLKRLAGWDEQMRDAPVTNLGGIQMIRREAVEYLEELDSLNRKARVRHTSGPNFLSGRGVKADA